MESVLAQSLRALAAPSSAGTCFNIAVTTASTCSTGLPSGVAVVTPSATVYFRQGATASASAQSTSDQMLLGGNTYRLYNLTPGNGLAFVTATGTANVHVAPSA